MGEILHKTGRKRIACDSFVSWYTRALMKRYTSMSLGEVNDRLIEGHGIITHDDAKVIDKAKELYVLLRKLDFPKRSCAALQEHLLAIQENAKTQLKGLINWLEEGSKPIYCTEVGNDRFKAELDGLEIKSISYKALQKGFDYLLRDILSYVNSGFVISHHGRSYPRNLFDDYQTVRDKVIKERKIDSSYVFDHLRIENVSPDLIIEEAMDFIGYVCDTTTWYEEDMAKQGIKITKDSRLSTFSFMKYYDNYNIRTRHPGEFDTWKFRENVEYIYDIPSLTKGYTKEILGQLEQDLAAVQTFCQWKESIKGSKKKLPAEKLIKMVDKILEKFIIPS